jgi:drug/metabolite transporter (DMT)-like permease
MHLSNLTGGIIALFSAVTWGSGDFAGGLASRRHNQFQVLAFATISASLSLLIAMLLRAEPWPGTITILWSVAAGISGAIGTACLYQALVIGQAALVAPTAAVVSVGLPIIVGTLTQGTPGLEKYIGMAAGMAGIWLVTRGTGSSHNGTHGLGLAILAGFGFGGFFLCIVHSEPTSVFAPLLLAKLTALLFCLIVLAFHRKNLAPYPLKTSGLALLAGVLDAAGNLFYILAARMIRFELATVISSMAPAMTVVWALLISRQKLSFLQVLGVGICLSAIALLII